MPKTILAIDDEETCLEVISFALESIGHTVITANTGTMGIEILKKSAHNIDVILLDMMLPDIYGIAALDTIKNIDHAKHIPVIIQTGSSNYNDLTQALSKGNASGVLMKPYGRKELIEIIDKSLNSTEVHNQV